MIFEENLKQLYYFYIVAKFKNFSTAAKKLFISQPAISMQIKNLEKNIGIQLIKRGNSFELTDKGRILANDLSKIFQKLYEAEHKLLAYSLKDIKKLTIGMSEAYSKHFIIEILNKFKHKFPEIGLKFFTENSIHLFDKISEGELDIAVIGEINRTTKNNNLITEDVKMEEIVVVSAPENRLTKKKKVTVNDILKEKIILKDENSATRNFITSLFNDISFPIYIECESTDILKKLIVENNGVTFLTRTNVINDIAEKRLKKLNFYKKLYMPIKIIYKKDLVKLHSANFLINIIENILKR